MFLGFGLLFFVGGGGGVVRMRKREISMCVYHKIILQKHDRPPDKRT